MTKQEKFEQHAVVELFDHPAIAGLVSEQSIGGEFFIRVDVPAIEGAPGFTKFFRAKVIYAITPVSEEGAHIAAAKLQIRPVSRWIIPDLTRALPELKPPIQFDDERGVNVATPAALENDVPADILENLSKLGL